MTLYTRELSVRTQDDTTHPLGSITRDDTPLLQLLSSDSTVGGVVRNDGYTRTEAEQALQVSIPMNNSRTEDMKLFKRSNLDGTKRLFFVESEFDGSFDSTTDYAGATPINNNPNAKLYEVTNKESDNFYLPKGGSKQLLNFILNRPKKGVDSKAGNAIRVANAEMWNHYQVEQSAILQGGFDQRLGYSTYDWMILDRAYINGNSPQTHAGNDGNNTDGIDLSTACYPISIQNTIMKNIGDACLDLKSSGVGRNNTFIGWSRLLRMHNKIFGSSLNHDNQNIYLKQIHANTIIDLQDWMNEFAFNFWFFNTWDDADGGNIGQMCFYNCLFRLKDGTLAKTFTRDQAMGGIDLTTINTRDSMVSSNTNTSIAPTDLRLDFEGRFKFLDTYDDYLKELDDLAVGTENSKLGSSPSGYDIIKDFSSDVLELEFEARDGNSGSWQRITPDSGLSSGEEYIGAMSVDITSIDSPTMQYRALPKRRSTGQIITVDNMVTSPF